MDDVNIKKIVIIGDGYVGKTSILHAIKQLDFQEQIPNVYEEFETEKTINGKKYRIKFIDTAGQEEYDMIRKLYYKEADVFLLCFSVDDKVSFDNVRDKWLADLQNYTHVPVVLVGTKLDLRTKDPNCIPRDVGQRFQKRISALNYVECSSKTGQGIEELKSCTIKALFTRQKSCVLQ